MRRLIVPDYKSALNDPVSNIPSDFKMYQQMRVMKSSVFPGLQVSDEVKYHFSLSSCLTLANAVVYLSTV